MKKLLILSALALVTASGCQCGPFGYYCRRDAVSTPAMMGCDPCDSCEGSIIGDSYLAPPTIVTPGPIVQ